MTNEIKSTVKHLLETEPSLRDSDERLVANVWAKELPDGNSFTALDFLQQYSEGNITTADSILRARRHLQQLHPELRGKTWGSTTKESGGNERKIQIVDMNEISPFSNGTEGMMWYSRNCDRCVKAYHPKDGEYPSDKTMKFYCSIGKECKLKYALDWSHVTGTISEEIAEQFNFSSMRACMFFSDDEGDKFHHPKRPKPDAPNQLTMPFIIEEIGFVKEKIRELI